MHTCAGRLADIKALLQRAGPDLRCESAVGPSGPAPPGVTRMAGDEPQQRMARTIGPEGAGDIGTVQFDNHVVESHLRGDVNLHQDVAAADDVISGGYDGDPELLAPLLRVLLECTQLGFTGVPPVGAGSAETSARLVTIAIARTMTS